MAIVLDDADDIIVKLRAPAFSLPHPEVFGIHHMEKEALQACRWSWDRGVFLARDVVVRRFRDVYVVRDGLVVRASDLSVYKSSVTQHTDYDVETGLAQLRSAIEEGSIRRLGGRHGLCHKPGSDNYGHWLNEMMPKATVYKDHVADRNLVYVVPNASGNLGSVIDASMDRLGIAADRVLKIAEPMWFEELLNVDGMTHHGSYMAPLTVQVARDVAKGVEAGSCRKVFVSRKGHIRTFARDEAIESALGADGWRIVRPGEMALAEQIALFKGAERVAGSMGAGMSNIVFAEPSCRVTVFSPGAMADTFFWFLAGLAGHRYREVRCPVTGPEKGRGDRDRDLDIGVEDVLKHLI